MPRRVIAGDPRVLDEVIGSGEIAVLISIGKENADELVLKRKRSEIEPCCESLELAARSLEDPELPPAPGRIGVGNDQEMIGEVLLKIGGQEISSRAMRRGF